MTLRRRILALQIASLAFIVLMIAVMGGGLWFARHSAQRVEGIDGRLAALADVMGKVGYYGEQVASVLLIGRTEDHDLETARIDMELALPRLTQATRDEIRTLTGMDEIEGELPELEVSQRLIEIYHSIDTGTNRALALQRAGQPSDAKEGFQRDVEFRLANEFTPLLTQAIEGERGEITSELNGTATVQIASVAAATVLALLALGTMIVLGLTLRRNTLGRIAELDLVAGAIVAGEPVRAPGQVADEFAGLAARLTELDATVAGQRRRFVEAGERLGADVEARTAQLRAANDRLREIDKRRGAFLADVSHELRTPLTILRGEADVALRGKDAAQQRQSLERIQAQAVELGQLLEDLIEFARSDAEDQPYITADIRLDDVVAAAAQEGEILAAPREIGISVALADNGCHVGADFRRLKQALIIGLDNAIKHSPPGGQVTLGTALTEIDVRITIEDEGPGIAEADLPRVFERFFRGSTSQSFTEGIGIGLAIAKEIIEHHGGTVSLGNRVEGGAVLTIGLPLGGLAA